MLLLFNGKAAFAAQQTAVAIEGTHIAAVGCDPEILTLETANSEKIDLAGKCLWPGLIDSHLHLEMYTHSLQTVDFAITTRVECLQRTEGSTQITC